MVTIQAYFRFPLMGGDVRCTMKGKHVSAQCYWDRVLWRIYGIEHILVYCIVCSLKDFAIAGSLYRATFLFLNDAAVSLCDRTCYTDV